MAQTVPDLGNAPSGFRTRPCARPGGWEGSSWHLQTVTPQSPAAEDRGGRCLSEGPKGLSWMGFPCASLGKHVAPENF